MKTKNFLPLTIITILSVILFGCSVPDSNQFSGKIDFVSYIDIPGITQEELEAIETLRNNTDYFIYGMPLSTEAFTNEHGEIRGFSALTCDWLTELFGIPFKPALYDWHDLLDGLKTGLISFTGELTSSEELLKIYSMTSAIASRPVKEFRVEGSKPFREIRETRSLRFGFIEGSATINSIVPEFEQGTYDLVFLEDYSQVYDALKNESIDSFYYSTAAEVNFIEHNDFIALDFYPLVYMPVSLATQDIKLKPVITAVEKALENGGLHYLTTLYNQAHKEYLKYKVYTSLSDEERAYIQNNPVVPIGVDPGNYPGCFYDKRGDVWAGIYLDILDEISAITGLTFERVNDENAEWPSILQMLENGDAALIPEMTQSPDRENKFLWPSTANISDRYVLISNHDFPDIKVNEVLYVKVGLAKNTAHASIFKKWFPAHPNTVEYESIRAAFAALQRGEVDMVMANQNRLLYLTHYLEQPGYKNNVVFDYPNDANLGLNINETVLLSIINKSLGLINTKNISENWMRKTYDYRSKVAEAQHPLFIGITVLSLIVLSLLAVLFFRTRFISKHLEVLVEERTDELALKTATLTTLFDSIPDLIFTKNLDFQYMSCNKAFLKHFGKRMEELIGKTDFEALKVPIDEAGWHNEQDSIIIRENKITAIEENIPSIDGTDSLYEISKAPLMLNGAAIGIIGIAHNITKLKKIEQDIAFSYEYSKKLNDALAKITKSPAISSGVLNDAANAVAQAGCRALNANRVVIFSYVQNQNILKNIASFDSIPSDNNKYYDYDLTDCKEFFRLLKSERLIIMNNRDECKLITDIIKKNNYLCAALDAPIRVAGQLFGVVCVEQWICDNYPEKREWTIEEHNFASSLADLIALAVSQAERHKALGAAELANQTKSNFLARMSHEIRTPMNAILGVTELMIMNEKLPSDIEEGLDKIYSSCDLLLGIINDILDFSKIEAGKLDIIPAQYKVASMINDSVHLNMMRIESKPIEFELQVDKNIPANLIGDSLRIKQILNNLLSNAFKYTDSGKVILSVSSEPIPLIAYLPDHLMSNQVKWLGHDKEGVTLVLSIRDTGYGMTKDQLSKMFEEYSRFSGKKNITVEGTGLGLAITERLINLMDGSISVESELEKGSLFTVRLPQEVVDKEILGSEVADNLQQFRLNFMTKRKRGKIVRDLMPYGSVLIVDDVETNIYVAVGLMKLYRLQIDTALNGQDAIDKIREGKVYDVIFMDHMMPEMDGIETTKQIRDFGYNEPIVALTANAVAGQADMFMRNGFNEFISKPIDINQLNSILNKFVRDKQPPEVIEAARMQKIEVNENAHDPLAEQPQINSLLQESFIRDASKAIAWLEKKRRNSDLADEKTLRKFTVIVHGIKSSLWNINEPELADFAYKLETCGKAKNTELIIENVPDFIKQLRALLERFENMRDGGKDNSDDEEDTGELCKKLKAIQEMASDYNRKGILDTISEISDCSKETKTILDKITELVLHSEFEETQKTAGDFEAALISKTTPAKQSSLLNNEISGLDLAKGLQRYEGNEQIYLKVLRSYAASTRSMLNAIENFSIDKLPDYKIKIHGIKGSSLDIYADKIGKEAIALDEAAKTGNIEFINEHNNEFLESAWNLVNEIDNLLFKLEIENPKPKKDKPDENLLVMLYTACKEYDINKADKAIEEIEKFKYESDDGLADWLRENIDRMDFKQIVQKLSFLDKQGG
ncbi:MAG: transporter substrate-binding domain-containing protein [Treponema sp.]|nr:transporter substrate-binding domain-containing protein [Treponema sp.]